MSCSDEGDGDDAAPEPTTTTTEATDDFERQVAGTATVAVGEETFEIELTACTLADERLTVQGDDQNGVTVVGTFTIDPPNASLTLTRGDEAWSVGGAGGTDVTDFTVDETSASGSGSFTFRSLATSDTAEGEASTTTTADDASPRDGSFDVSCES